MPRAFKRNLRPVWELGGTPTCTAPDGVATSMLDPSAPSNGVIGTFWVTSRPSTR